MAKKKDTSWDYVDCEIGLTGVGFHTLSIEVSLHNVEENASIVIGSDSPESGNPSSDRAIESAILTLQLAITRLQALRKKRDRMQSSVITKINETVREIDYSVLGNGN